MNASRRGLTRLIAVGAAAVVVGVPIALVASTWKPLDPPRVAAAKTKSTSRSPRGGRIGKMRIHGVLKSK